MIQNPEHGEISITGIRLWIIRLLALPCIVVGIIVVNDGLFAARDHQTATIKSKQVCFHQKSWSGHTYNLHVHTDASGNGNLSGDVPEDFYNECRPGDTLQLTITPYLKEWQHVELLRDGKIVAEASMLGDGLLGFLLFIPFLTYVPKIAAIRNFIFWFPVILIEIGIVAVCAFKFLTPS